MRGRRDGRIPEEVPGWLVSEGVPAGALEEAFLVQPGRGLLMWVVFGATAVPSTLVATRLLGHDPPTWGMVAFCLTLGALVWLASTVAYKVEARRWVLACGVRPAKDMVMARTADELLIWNLALLERTPERLILRRTRGDLSGRRCWGSMAFELTTGGGERLTFTTDLPSRPAVDRLLAALDPVPSHHPEPGDGGIGERP